MKSSFLVFCLTALFAVSYSNNIYCLYQLENAYQTLFSLQDSILNGELPKALTEMESLGNIAENIVKDCDETIIEPENDEDTQYIKSCEQSVGYVTNVISGLFGEEDPFEILQKLISFLPKFKDTCITNIAQPNKMIEQIASTQESLMQDLKNFIKGLDLIDDNEENDSIQKILESLDGFDLKDVDSYLADILDTFNIKDAATEEEEKIHAANKTEIFEEHF